MNFLRKKLLLLLGFAFLISAWYWEKVTLVKHEEEKDQLLSLHEEFYKSLSLDRIYMLKTMTFKGFRQIDSNSVSTLNMCLAYMDEILQSRSLTQSAEAIGKKEIPSKEELLTTNQRLFDSCQDLVDRKDEMGLARLANKIRRETSSVFGYDQGMYYERIQELEKEQEWKRILQLVLYAIGTILITANQFLQDQKQEVWGEELLKKISVIHHRINESIKNDQSPKKPR